MRVISRKNDAKLPPSYFALRAIGSHWNDQPGSVVHAPTKTEIASKRPRIFAQVRRERVDAGFIGRHHTAALGRRQQRPRRFSSATHSRRSRSRQPALHLFLARHGSSFVVLAENGDPRVIIIMLTHEDRRFYEHDSPGFRRLPRAHDRNFFT
jgi:hypothetical protein